MILRVRMSKLHFASWIPVLFLIIAMLAHAPFAGAQALTFEPADHQLFDGRSGVILGTVYLGRVDLPAAQIVVTIRSLFSGAIQRVLTDFSGHFELHGIPPGAYEISVQEQGYNHTSTITQVNTFPSQVVLNVRSSSPSSPSGSAYMVSVRELKIPTKVQDEYNRGLERLAKGDPAGSLSHFNKATDAFPEYYEAYYQIGVAESRLKHEDNAMEAFQKSIDLSGGRYARAQFAYGLLLCQQGKPVEAEPIIRTGLETDSNSSEGHLFLAMALIAQNRLQEAEKSLREALLRRPKYADAYLVLADLHGEKRDYRSQMQDLDTYLKLAPSGPGSDIARRMSESATRRLSQPTPQN